jgi:hypothetical protein
MNYLLANDRGLLRSGRRMLGAKRPPQIHRCCKSVGVKNLSAAHKLETKIEICNGKLLFVIENTLFLFFKEELLAVI